MLRHDATAGHLVCPFPDCEDPRLTVRGTRRVRDHFAHRSGGHAPETLAHHTGKNLIGAWLRRAYPKAAVHVDTCETESGARPDVFLSLPCGRKVAYEVQLAHLTEDEWLKRHHRYRNEGIRDVWLFGGIKYYRPLGGGGALKLGRVALKVLDSEHPILFLDPRAEQLGWVVGEGVIPALGGSPIGGGYRAEWFDLTDCQPMAGVPNLPGLHEQMRRGRQFRQHLAEERSRDDALQRSAHWRDEEWGAVRAKLELERGRPLPRVIDLSAGEDVVQNADEQGARAVEREQFLWPWSASHWRWLIMAELDHHIGSTLSMAALLDASLPGHEKLGGSWPRQLDCFLTRLRDAGYIWFAGQAAPVAKEGILVLSGEAGEPPPETPNGRRLLANPSVCLIESASARIVWQASQAVDVLRLRSNRGRSTSKWSALPPGVLGTVTRALAEGPDRGRLPPLQ
ncbi:competence protein CoiA family protein [uncultured Serinicoccus sp.]|uniref:competence protein CoiA family protein n=1 Tax=uncultured Serinicoccus sp. TaxID=735514 RepID=UPI00262F18E5|nr:competence protein CoiA family protein [uncultured Serinicoccus sp.]